MGSAAALFEMRNRLRSLDTLRVTPPSPSVQVDRRQLGDLCDLLGAELHGNPTEGRYLCVRHSFADGHRHGRQELRCPPNYPARALSLLAKDARLESVAAADALFLDIETTGLAGGAGTMAFLVGLGMFVDDRLEVLQFFLPGPADERAFLDAIAGVLQSRSLLVTYNGRCFDAPLMQARFTLQRQRLPLVTWPHLDLLYPARNVYRARLPDCCLSTVETGVLGVVRSQDDIPGALIPGIYFDYLREGATERLPGVFYHNLMDIASLAALTGALIQVAAGDTACHPLDHMGAGRMLELAGRWHEAKGAYARAARGANGRQQAAALLRLAAMHKRLGEYAEAASIWQGLVGSRCDASGEAHVELAKHLEHRARDYQGAAEATKLAQDLAAAQREPLKSDLARRLGRLQRKLGARGPSSLGEAN